MDNLDEINSIFTKTDIWQNWKIWMWIFFKLFYETSKTLILNLVTVL